MQYTPHSDRLPSALLKIFLANGVFVPGFYSGLLLTAGIFACSFIPSGFYAPAPASRSVPSTTPACSCALGCPVFREPASSGGQANQQLHIVFRISRVHAVEEIKAGEAYSTWDGEQMPFRAIRLPSNCPQLLSNELSPPAHLKIVLCSSSPLPAQILCRYPLHMKILISSKSGFQWTILRVNSRSN